MTYRPSMLRKLVAAFAALILLATSCGGSSDSATESQAPAPSPAEETQAEEAPAEETQAEDDGVAAEASLVATTVSGGQIDFGSLEGQDVVLWFWAPW